jgi:hypothetical protein
LKYQNIFPGRKCIRLRIKLGGRLVLWARKLLRPRAKRKYEKHFISKLTDADGEQLETQHWIETAVTAVDSLYLSKELANKLIDQYLSIGRMLNSMMNKSSTFCFPSIKN